MTTEWPFEPPQWAQTLQKGINEINRKVSKLMALVQIEQTDLDNVAAALETVVTELQNVPPGVLPAANEDALNQAVTDLQAAATALVPPTPAP